MTWMRTRGVEAYQLKRQKENERNFLLLCTDTRSFSVLANKVRPASPWVIVQFQFGVLSRARVFRNSLQGLVRSLRTCLTHSRGFYFFFFMWERVRVCVRGVVASQSRGSVEKGERHLSAQSGLRSAFEGLKKGRNSQVESINEESKTQGRSFVRFYEGWEATSKTS